MSVAAPSAPCARASPATSRAAAASRCARQSHDGATGMRRVAHAWHGMLSGPAIRLLIAGGGTGGHLFPGVALAEELRAREPDAAIKFVGTRRGIEARVLPELGWDLDFIEVSGL